MTTIEYFLIFVSFFNNKEVCDFSAKKDLQATFYNILSLLIVSLLLCIFAKASKHLKINMLIKFIT